tara:strand:+ start:233 stop:1096 length:864 start_codon:yes stop_codon:yes gene_type:complete
MKTLKVMMVSATLVLLSGCGLSESEKTDVALVTCSIMGESRGMDGAVRVKEINNAREKLGEDVFVEGDKSIGEAFEHGLCQELVLNDKDYSSKLANSYQEKAARILSNIDKAREDELSVIAEIQNAIHGFHTRMSFDQFEELARSLDARSVETRKVDDRTLFMAYFSECRKKEYGSCSVFSEESSMKIGEIRVYSVYLNIDPAEIESYLDTYKVPHRTIGINVHSKDSELLLSFLTPILGPSDGLHTLDLAGVVIETPYWKLSTDLDEITIAGGHLNLVQFDEPNGT